MDRVGRGHGTGRADAAASFATVLIASAEGAVVLCRAEQSLAPLEAVAAQMLEQARRATPRGKAR